MNYKHFFYLLFALVFFVACQEDGTPVQDEKIDATADDVKKVIDLFGDKARKFLDDGGMDKIKDVIDEVAVKGKDISKDSPELKAKLAELKEDPEVKDLLKKYEGDGRAVFGKLADFFSKLEKEGVIKQDGNIDLSEDEMKLIVEKHKGDAKEIFSDLESSLKNISKDPALKAKLEDLKNDAEIKELLKKYEQDGLDILKKVEAIFKDF